MSDRTFPPLPEQLAFRDHSGRTAQAHAIDCQMQDLRRAGYLLRDIAEMYGVGISRVGQRLSRLARRQKWAATWEPEHSRQKLCSLCGVPQGQPHIKVWIKRPVDPDDLGRGQRLHGPTPRELLARELEPYRTWMSGPPCHIRLSAQLRPTHYNRLLPPR